MDKSFNQENPFVSPEQVEETYEEVALDQFGMRKLPILVKLSFIGFGIMPLVLIVAFLLTVLIHYIQK